MQYSFFFHLSCALFLYFYHWHCRPIITFSPVKCGSCRWSFPPLSHFQSLFFLFPSFIFRIFFLRIINPMNLQPNKITEWYYLIKRSTFDFVFFVTVKTKASHWLLLLFIDLTGTVSIFISFDLHNSMRSN